MSEFRRDGVDWTYGSWCTVSVFVTLRHVLMRLRYARSLYHAVVPATNVRADGMI